MSFMRVNILMVVVMFSVFLGANQNIIQQDLDTKNKITTSTTQALSNNIIRIRIYDLPPALERIKCNMPCHKECSEKVILKSKRSFSWSFKAPDSITIGMTPTETSKKALAEGGGYNKINFEEYEIKGSDGEFNISYSFYASNKILIQVSYNVILLAGKEYELYAYGYSKPNIYLINTDGTTSRVSTMYPKECGLFDKKDIIK